MGYPEISNIGVTRPDKSKIQKRTNEIQRLVNDFIGFYENKHNIKISAIDDIAAKLSSAYFSICYTHVKPVVDDKINVFKMASIMELLIVKEQVLHHPESTEEDDTKNRQLNADFAMGAALSMISCMITNASQEIIPVTVNSSVNISIQERLEDHAVWLRTKPLTEMPVFINAQFYQMLEMIRGLPLQIHG
jgi:hypothetical protein